MSNNRNANRSRTPVVPNDSLTGTTLAEAHELDDSNDREISLGSEMTLEELRDSLNKPGTIDISSPDFRSTVEELAFMDEKVLVFIFDSNEKNAEKVINVFNDGTPQRFVRGEWTIAKRKYVEVLARSKPFSVATPEIDDGDGGRTTSIRTTAGLLYPFDMRDKNPAGKAWLQRVLAEA